MEETNFALFPIWEIDWQPHGVITLSHFTSLFVKCFSTFVLFLLQFFFQKEGRAEKVELLHKEREEKERKDETLSCALMIRLPKWNYVKKPITMN